MNTCKVEKVDLKKTRLLNATHVVNDACNDNLKFGFQTWYNVVFEGERYSDIRAVFNIKNSIVGFKVWRQIGGSAKTHVLESKRTIVC